MKSSIQKDPLSADANNNDQPLIIQQRLPVMQKEISQKPEPPVGVSKSNFFNNKDEDKDAANCLTSFNNSISPQTHRNNDDSIVKKKTLLKRSISLHIPKDYPITRVVANKPTIKMTGFAGKEEPSNNKMKNDDALLNDCSEVVDLNGGIRSEKSIIQCKKKLD